MGIQLRKTSVERHQVKGQTVYVKREDLCTAKETDAPTFSKVRGLAPYLKQLKDKGFTTVGYVETSVSMAGWGVAWLAPQFGLRAVIFDPQYRITDKRLELEPHLRVLQFHRQQWEKLGAKIIPIQPGRAKVNYYVARKWIGNKKLGDKMHLLPLGLPLKTTGQETAQIALDLSQQNFFSSVVVNVGSGTICAGVLKGFSESVGTTVHGVMGRKGDTRRKGAQILQMAGFFPEGRMFRPDFEIHPAKYEYTQPSMVDCPFPCHPYYDLKAWEWLVDHIDELEKPILFWNIGSLPKEASQ